MKSTVPNIEAYDPIKHQGLTLVIKGGGAAGRTDRLYVELVDVKKFLNFGYKTRQQYIKIEEKRKRQGKPYIDLAELEARDLEKALSEMPVMHNGHLELPVDSTRHIHNGEETNLLSMKDLLK